MALFDGKRAFVTGGTTGIGRAIAMMLAREGAQVLICGRTEATLQDALTALGGAHGGFIADVSTEEGRNIIARKLEEFGGLDILINNVGFAEGELLEEDDVEKSLYMIATNYGGYVACTKLALKHMEQQGSGEIINIGSMSVASLKPGKEIYASSKAAVRAFSTMLAKSMKDKNVRVSLIEPGLVGSDMQPQPPDEQRQMEEQEEMLFAEDIANAVCYCLLLPHRVTIPMMQVVPFKQK